MSGFRLPTGGFIHRDLPVEFTFNGRSVSGFDGDSITSALMASGHMLVGRGFKYHRPRGITSSGVEESGAIFTTIKGDRQTPNVKGPIAEIHEGLEVRSQNAFPSVRYDIGEINDMLSPFFGAGFYYKTFMGPFSNTRFWMFIEKFIRRAAGLGTASRISDPDNYDIANGYCDLLVVGAGRAGLLAAAEAAEAGMDVLLVEQDFEAGGRLLHTGQGADESLRASLLDRFAKAGGKLMLRTTAFGLYDGHVAGLIERQSDHLADPHETQPRETMHIIRTRHIMLATGAIERTPAFACNDRPGVMQAGAMAAYVNRFAVAPGRSLLLATTHDAIYGDALRYRELGLNVTLLDARLEETELQEQARAAGIELYQGLVPYQSVGRKAIAGLQTAYLGSDGELSTGPTVGAEAIGLSNGYNPVVHLLSHRGVKPVWNDHLQAFIAGDTSENITLIGRAAGVYLPDQIEQSVHHILAALTGKKVPSGTPQLGFDTPLMPLFEIKHQNKRKRAFIDPQHDVTTKDVRQAHQEGFVSVEHMKRYTTLGMATDQGKVGNIPGLAIMAEASGRTIAETGTTTFRPPYTPVSIGVLAGRARGAHWMPERRTPMHQAHLDAGAVMTDAGLWKRAWYYPQAGEDINDAYIREAAITRQTVAMIDVSTLGKIQVQGPDATTFLDRVYVNNFAKLPVGKSRYGLMLRDDGVVLDDGTTWRMGQNDYLMTTTTAQAGPVMAHLEELLQTRMQDLKVHLTSVTDQWAAVAVAGPAARSVLSSCLPTLDWSDEGFPFMAVRTGEAKLAAGVSSLFHAARISFSGERAWEVYVPADKGRALWDHLYQGVEAAGGCAYGMEALGALRIEKGHVTGAELDGRVTLEDAGFGKMASKTKNYIGAALRTRPELTRSDRKKLVGILPKDRTQTFGAGAILCAPDHVKGFGEGWITAVTHSPALGHWIGLGFVSGGVEAWEGREIVIADPVRGAQTIGQIVSPHMFDPKNDRLKG